MKIKHKKHAPKGFTLVELLVVIAIIAGLAAMSYGPIMRQVKASKRTEAINNGKQIHTALMSFAQDNDSQFPSELTARDGETGDTAEACFTQLLNAGVIDDEKYFYNAVVAERLATTAETPDNDGTLTSGECTWGYVSGLSMTSKSGCPVVFDSSTQPGTFDTGVWDGKAVVVRLDGAATAMDIEYSGSALEDDGSSKQGPIVEEKGSTKVDIFKTPYLPARADVLVPSL